MTSDLPKEVRYVWYTVILVLVVQIAGLAYVRKKFDDNILILQSSENAMNMKVESIELMLLKMKEPDRVPVAAPKASSEKKTETETPVKESSGKEGTDKPAAEKE